MKCPYCKEKMKQGFIVGDRYSLKWISEEKYKGPFSQLLSNGIKLSDSFINNDVEAFCCLICNKIVIDIGNKIHWKLKMLTI